MSVAVYSRYELLRIARNRQALIFSVAFPVVMYFLLAGPNKDNHNFGGDAKHPTGLFAPQYYMVGLLAFGTMVAVMSCGARIAHERTTGWARQVRLSPMPARSYLQIKILTGYVLAGVTMGLLFGAGVALGVRLPALTWLHLIGLVLVALIPFAGLGVAMGHLLNDDSAGSALGIGASLFAFLGGTWFPVTGDDVFAQFCRSLPSYWLVQAGHVGLGVDGDPWGLRGWLTVAAWSIACVALAGWAYRRDTRRA